MAQSELILTHQHPLNSSSLDTEAEIQRIRDGEPLILTERDEKLHQWLDEQREAGNPGFICSAKGSGVSNSCQYYRGQHVKRKGIIQQLPVPVVYIRIPALCGAKQFYISALEALSHTIRTGKLRDVRSRTRGTLKSYGTRLLIIDDAEFLSYEAFCEIAQIYDVLKIPAVLSGTYYLEKVLKKRYWDRIGNSFLDFYEYPPMTKNEIVEAIHIWETEFLNWHEESDFLNEDVVNEIYRATGGLKDALSEVLRKSAIRTLKNGSYKIDATTIRSILNRRAVPQIRPGGEE